MDGQTERRMTAFGGSTDKANYREAWVQWIEKDAQGNEDMHRYPLAQLTYMTDKHRGTREWRYTSISSGTVNLHDWQTQWHKGMRIHINFFRHSWLPCLTSMEAQGIEDMHWYPQAQLTYMTDKHGGTMGWRYALISKGTVDLHDWQTRRHNGMKICIDILRHSWLT